MILTHKNIHAALNCGSPNRHQCKLLGISYPLPAGWLRKLIGTQILDGDYAKLITLRKDRPTRTALMDTMDSLVKRANLETTAIEEFRKLLSRNDSAGIEKIATMLSYARANELKVNMKIEERKL